MSLTIYLQVASGTFGRCPFFGYDSVVAGHLFAGAPIVFWGFVLCVGVVMFFGSFLVVGNHLTEEERAGPEVIKLFSCSIQVNMKFQLLIETNMLKIKDFPCFQTIRCCIYHANKC